MNKNPSNICNWCNQLSFIIWVHGHGHCSVCGINVDECCRGEVAHQPTPSRLVRRSSNEDGGEGEKNKNEND